LFKMKRKKSHLNEGSVKRRKSNQKKSRVIQSGHPHGVKPYGNILYDQSSCFLETRNNGLGKFSVLSDSMILILIKLPDIDVILILALISKVFWIFTETDELWMYIAILRQGKIKMVNSWKSTVFGRITSILEDIKIESFYSDVLYNTWFYDSIDPFIWTERDNVDRKNHITVDDFVLYYEAPNIPVILNGLGDDWSAYKNWNREKVNPKYEPIFYFGSLEKKYEIKYDNYYTYYGSITFMLRSLI